MNSPISVSDSYHIPCLYPNQTQRSYFENERAELWHDIARRRNQLRYAESLCLNNGLENMNACCNEYIKYAPAIRRVEDKAAMVWERYRTFFDMARHGQNPWAYVRAHPGLGRILSKARKLAHRSRKKVYSLLSSRAVYVVETIFSHCKPVFSAFSNDKENRQKYRAWKEHKKNAFDIARYAKERGYDIARHLDLPTRLHVDLMRGYFMDIGSSLETIASRLSRKYSRRIAPAYAYAYVIRQNRKLNKLNRGLR
jgi:hypothetical protein